MRHGGRLSGTEYGGHATSSWNRPGNRV
jgi:hypothetical protein